MLLKRLVLQNFRNYNQAEFTFSENTTVIIGPNTAGKTNLTEAILYLTTGKSGKGARDEDVIAFGQEVARVQGMLLDNVIANKVKQSSSEIAAVADSSLAMTDEEKIKLEVVFANAGVSGSRFVKKYMVDEVPKSRMKFSQFLPTVLFRPEELDIIIDGPSLRRDFLDSVLEQVDTQYLRAKIVYDKALRHRNALLHLAREVGRKNEKEFSYFDELLISNGQIIHEKRRELLEFINTAKKDIFQFSTAYDHSIISEARLEQYKDAELAAAKTLVGPHRDDVQFFLKDHDLRYFGSRGQQRLVVLQLKLLQIAYIVQSLHKKPLLVLDDIFSELDSGHIALVLSLGNDMQRIITTTHKEFIPEKDLKKFAIIALDRKP